MGKLVTAATILSALLLSDTGAVHAQDAGIDRTLPEMGGDSEAGTLNVSVEGSITSIPYFANDAGEALYQGDIMLGPADRLAAVGDGASLMSLEAPTLFGLGRRDVRARWPDGVMRYMLHPDLPDKHRVYTAIAAWEAATHLRFEEIVQPGGDYVEFVRGAGCSSYVGMIGGRQPLNLADACSTGNTIHEIGHALGLHHEQARDDRDDHVEVRVANIEPGREGNFLRDPLNYEDIGPYCHGSIMHYGPYAFSRQPYVLKTIETNPPGIRIGQRDHIAPCDAETIAAMYSRDLSDDAVTGFQGTLELFPEGCRSQRKCNLRHTVEFTDPWQVRWRAPARDPSWPASIRSGTTDGASIPRWAWPIVGEPFDDLYLLAAVVHDHYCYEENLVRSWRQTHRMFYDALVALRVPPVKAKIMYAAVYLGGPKWIDLVPGSDCGPNCIFDAVAGSSALVRSDDRTLYVRETLDEDQDVIARFEAISRVIETVPEISLTDIETALNALQDDDVFYNSGNSIAPTGPDDPILR